MNIQRTFTQMDILFLPVLGETGKAGKRERASQRQRETEGERSRTFQKDWRFGTVKLSCRVPGPWSAGFWVEAPGSLSFISCASVRYIFFLQPIELILNVFLFIVTWLRSQAVCCPLPSVHLSYSMVLLPWHLFCLAKEACRVP